MAQVLLYRNERMRRLKLLNPSHSRGSFTAVPRPGSGLSKKGRWPVRRTLNQKWGGEARLESRGIEFHAPDFDVEIIADRGALIRAFRNLLDNALKYGGAGMNEIKVAYSENGEFHILSVTDNGVGIAPQDREKIFDPFQRNYTSQGTMGSGLGLAIVKEVAEKYGGHAWVEGEPTGRGATFYICIAKDLNVAAQHRTP